MKQINEIFYKGIHPVNENIIRTIDIDWDMHSKGILNIAKSFEPDFVINPHLYAIMSVWALDRITGFSDKGKDSFDNLIRKELEKPPEEQSEVIVRWLNGCRGLKSKKDNIMYGPS